MIKALSKTEVKTTSLYRSNQILQAGLKAFADHISTPLTPLDLIAAYGTVKDTEDVVKTLTENLRKRTLEQLQTNGEQVTEKGTMRLEVDDMTIEARPQKTGYDPKKIEGLLRAKQASVSEYMAQVITYAIDETKLHAAVTDGVLTQDELNTCKHEVNYALQRPKKVSKEQLDE